MVHYTNHSIEIQDTADVTATILGSLSQISTPIDNDIQQSETAGTYFPEHVSLVNIQPRTTFSTFDIEKMLDKFGVVGSTLVEDTGKVGLAIYQAQYENSGVVGGAVHRRLRFPYSYGMNRTISASHRQDATLDAEAMAIWDETNDPLVIEDTVALPSLPGSPGRWTIGKVTVGGILIPCITDINIDFGINPTMFGCDSDIYEKYLNLDSVQPVVTFTSLDVTAFAAAKVPLQGLCAQHVDTVFYLRKRKACTGGFEDDGDLVHVKFTADGIFNMTDAHTATGNQRAQVQMTLTCRQDTGNTPIIATTKSAIT